MARCPHCQAQVSLRRILAQTGRAGVVCPNCQASLEPTRWSFAVALAGGLLAGYGANHFLRQSGAGVVWEFIGWIGSFLVVSLTLLALLVRLRVKSRVAGSLRQAS